MLFSKQILNGSQDFFFHSNVLIFIHFFKYEIIETHARAFLKLIILGIATVLNDYKSTNYFLNAPTDEFYVIVYWHNSVQHVSCRLELLKETFFSVIYYYGFHILIWKALKTK